MNTFSRADFGLWTEAGHHCCQNRQKTTVFNRISTVVSSISLCSKETSLSRLELADSSLSHVLTLLRMFHRKIATAPIKIGESLFPRCQVIR